MMKIQWKMRKNEALWMAGGLLLISLLGTALFSGIILCVDDGAKAAFPLGTMMAAAIVVIGHLIVGVFDMTRAFGLSVSMGATRKGFVWSYAGFSFLELLAGYGLVRFCFILEKQIVFRATGLPMLEDAEKFVQGSPGPAILVLTGVLAAELFFAALVLRYGEKVYAVLGLFLLALCYVPQILRARGAFSGNSAFAQWAGQGAGWAFPVIAAATLAVEAALLAAAWVMLGRQQVNA